MIYGIIERQGDNTTLVGTTRSFTELLNELVEKYPESTWLPNSCNIKLQEDNTIADGTYLVLANPVTHSLVNKQTALITGYIYNSSQSVVTTIKSWELVPIQSQTELDILYKPWDPIKSIPINIPRFHPNQIQSNDTVVLIGPTNKGKSTMIAHMLNHFSPEKLAQTLIISPTENANPFYSKLFGTAQIMHQLSNELVHQFINDCASQNKVGAIVFDDCFAYQNKLHQIEHIIRKAKQHNITIIATCLHPLSIEPRLDELIDTVCLFEESFICTQRKLFSRYTHFFKSFDIFKHFFQNATQNHGCLVILNKKPTDYPFDRMAWCRADLIN